MIIYLDSSALVKRYVAEAGSELVRRTIDSAEVLATAGISRVEVVAALARASRLGALPHEEAQLARQLFEVECRNLLLVPSDTATLRQGASLAWDLGLRGYDAMQLASAVILQELLDQPVSLMTFDRQLWTASLQTEITPLPEALPSLLERWKEERSVG